MNILIVSSEYVPHVGGKSTHIIDLIEGLKKNHVNVFLISRTTFGKKREYLIKMILSPIRVLNKDLFDYLHSYVRNRVLNSMVEKFCVEYQVDLISIQEAATAHAIKKTIQKHRIKTILTMHTYFGLEKTMDRKMDKRKQKYYEKVLAFELEALTIVSGIITVDQRIRQHIIDNILNSDARVITPDKVKMIPNFTNIGLYNIPSNEEKTYYRNKYGINPDYFVICCVRRLVEKNGVINAVKAMSKIKDSNVVLLIAGDGIQKKLIKEFISNNKLAEKVILLGSLNGDKVRELYMLSDISIVPSITVNGLQEATSISAIESMACGVPTIASNIGGLKQLIKNHETGILVDEGNIEQIANAIIKLKNNTEYYSHIQNNSREYIELNHSNIKAAKEYYDAFVSF